MRWWYTGVSSPRSKVEGVCMAEQNPLTGLDGKDPGWEPPKEQPPGAKGKPATGPAPKPSNHFVATCAQFRSLGFVSRGLRNLYRSQGREGKEQPTLLRFQAGVFDTKAQGFTEEEAGLIKEDLAKCTMTG